MFRKGEHRDGETDARLPRAFVVALKKVITREIRTQLAAGLLGFARQSIPATFDRTVA